MRKQKRKTADWRSAFTLVELLTVIGIIGLLIAILLPSLSKARDQARRVKVRATIAAIDKGLEMFRNDFGEYPDSDIAGDPIRDFPGASETTDAMWGAHRLARALVGHDFRGVDAEGRVLTDGCSDLPETQITMAELEDVDRVGVYMDKITLARDTDPRWGEGDRHPPSGRPFVADDAYEYPILYYRANPRAPAPFAEPEADAPKGVYKLWDNFGLTGIHDDNGPRGFWDFAKTGMDLGCHPLGELGSMVPSRVNNPPAFCGMGKTFAGFLHNENALKAGGVVKPHNPDRFILIHSGGDGVYGTADDIPNF